MSFSNRVKDELVRLPLGMPVEIKAELAGMLLSSGTLNIDNRGLGLNWETEGAQVARRLYALLRRIQEDLKIQIRVGGGGQVGSSQRYRLEVAPQENLTRLMEELGLVEKNRFPTGQVPWKLLKGENPRRAFLRGYFLGRGSINNPGSGYYLEILCERKEIAEGIQQVESRLGLTPGIRNRRNFWLVYLNRAEDILNFLNLTGAHRILLDVESNRIFKEMRGTVNRRVNWETANLEKTIQAGLKQLEDIRTISLNLGLTNLPPGLQDIARLRIRYPHLTLKELGDRCNPPVGKSGVNHRMRRISRIAEEIRKEGK